MRSAALLPAPASAEPYVIKFPHVVAPATPKGQMAQRFKQLAEERFPGRVRVEVYPSAQLMEDTESIEALAFGEVQMIAASLSLFDRLTPKIPGVRPAVLVPGPRGGRALSSEPGRPRAADDARRTTACSGLQFWHNGMKQFSGPRPLIAPGRCARAQVPRHGVGHPASRDRGDRRQPAEDGVRRGLSGAADGHGRRAGEHLVEHLLVEVLRGAAVHDREQSRLHRLLRRRERAVLAVAARRSARGARGRARRGHAWGNARSEEINQRRPATHRRLGPLRDHGADARAARGVAGRDAPRVGRVPRPHRRRARRTPRSRRPRSNVPRMSAPPCSAC